MLNTPDQSFKHNIKEEEVIPLGTAKIMVVNGKWTFNNKPLEKCNFPIQMTVENFIRGCAFALPFKLHERKRSYSNIETKQTVYAHSHLKQHNHKFSFIPNKSSDFKPVEGVNNIVFEKVA